METAWEVQWRVFDDMTVVMALEVMMVMATESTKVMRTVPVL